MHTNILIDNQLIDRARELTGIQSKRELVDYALRRLIQIEEQSIIKNLRGKLHWEGDINISRENRLNDCG